MKELDAVEEKAMSPMESPISEFLRRLPSAAEVRKQLEKNTEERKQLQRLLKVVENEK